MQKFGNMTRTVLGSRFNSFLHFLILCKFRQSLQKSAFSAGIYKLKVGQKSSSVKSRLSILKSLHPGLWELVALASLINYKNITYLCDI